MQRLLPLHLFPMELQFQQPQSHPQQQCNYQMPDTKETKPRTRSKCGGSGGGGGGGGGGGSSSKFVGVRQRPSGRWVAEIKDTTQKIRMWLGTFETAEEAARAYDEAACLLRGANTRTNFAASAHASPPDSPLAARIRGILNHKRMKKNASQPMPMPMPTVNFFPAAYRRAGDIARAAGTSSTSTSTITTTTSSVSPSSSPSSSISFAMGSNRIRTPPIMPAAQSVADEAYRPYLASGGGEEFQLATQQYEQPWALNTSRLPPSDGCDMANENACLVVAEVDKVKVEKKSSASPHGMDRVQDKDVFDAGNDASDSLWDLPPICPLSCRSLMY